MLALWERDGVTQKELVARLDIEQATIANTLTRMERDGLIRRTRHPTDARAQQIWLTSRSRDIRDRAYAAANEVNGIALANLNESERAALIDYMTRIIAAMQMPRD